MNQLIQVYNHQYELSRRPIGYLPQKNGKGKLLLFRSYGERVIFLYASCSTIPASFLTGIISFHNKFVELRHVIGVVG